MSKLTNKLHVLIQSQSGIWVGQCVEHDICVQADSLTELRKIFKQTVQAEMRVGPLSAISPPPKKFQDIFQKGGNADWKVISIML